MRDPEAITRRFVRMDGADAVELPYLRRELAMRLIVPHELDGLAAVEASLNAVSPAELAEIAQRGTVYLTTPKWEQTLPPADLFA